MPNLEPKCGFTQINVLHSNASHENLGQQRARSAHSPRVAFSFRLKIYIFRIGKGREGRERVERGGSGILRHKNVHFGEDKMYEGAKRGRKKGPFLTGWVRLRDQT